MKNFIGQDLGVHGNIIILVGKCALSVAVVCSQADGSFSLLLSVWPFGDLLDSSLMRLSLLMRYQSSIRIKPFGALNAIVTPKAGKILSSLRLHELLQMLG